MTTMTMMHNLAADAAAVTTIVVVVVVTVTIGYPSFR